MARLHDGRQSYRNSLGLAAQTWVLARKPLGTSVDAPGTTTPEWRALHSTVSVADIFLVSKRLSLQTVWIPSTPAIDRARNAIGDSWKTLDAGVYFPAVALAEVAEVYGLHKLRIAITPHAHGAFAAVLGAPRAAIWSGSNWEGLPPEMIVFHGLLEYAEDPMADLAVMATGLAPGGVVFGVVRIILNCDAALHDGWHRPALRSFTTSGLAASALRAGLTVIKAGYWGTWDYIDSLIDGVPKPAGLIPSGAKAVGDWPRASVAWIYAEKTKPGPALNGADPQVHGVCNVQCPCFS